MTFAYYNKLSASQKRIYRMSDGITAITLPGADGLHECIVDLERALAAEERARIEESCRKIADSITQRLSLPPVRVAVLSVRPAGTWGELHGLYETASGRSSAKITLWMRTVKHRRVVAFRSFLRTLLHELCHHLDYALFRLADSFHTEGFYKRESALFHQIMQEHAGRPSGPPARNDTPDTRR